MIEFDRDFVMTINGRSVASNNAFPVYNPANRRAFANAPDASREQLDDAVSGAAAAFESWRKEPYAVREKALNAMADLMEANAAEFMALLTREQGKPKAGAEWEVFGSIHWCREIAKQRLEDEILEDTDARRVVTRFAPLGVVGGITPWNFPILLAIWKIAPALISGNTMVLKPSPFTPLCTLKLGELMRDELPAGVFNVVSGGDDLGKWMTAHPGISKIAFTGHTETGKRVMQSSAGSLKRLTLELGGNDPAIVLPDVDAKAVAPELFWAAFQNNAQFCNATKRLYVHEDIYDDVLKELVEYAKTVKVSDGAEDGAQLGPIQNAPQYEKVMDYFEDCKKNGYRFAVGGDIDNSAQGWFIPVTLVDNPPEDSRIVQEEPFGPILPVLKWRDDADVVRRANDTPYGLGASVWGKDLERVARIGEQIDAGTVWLNEIHMYSPGQTFGGAKESGIGYENGVAGLKGYAQAKTITINKQPKF